MIVFQVLVFSTSGAGLVAPSSPAFPPASTALLSVGSAVLMDQASGREQQGLAAEPTDCVRGKHVEEGISG